MVSSFDIVKLKSFLKDFYTLTQIRITVFNDRFEELIAYPENIPSFCQLIRQDPDGERQCRLCDQNACKIAALRHTTYSYQCHAGLTEAISPIHIGNIVIGYLFFGHVFSYPTHDKGWPVIHKLCQRYDIDMNRLKQYCFEQPIIPGEFISSASNLLYAVASFLCMERMIFLKQNDFPLQVDQYIIDNLTNDINARDICNHFKIGKTHLYDISKQNYGCGIAEHIRNLRISKAKSILIENSEMSTSTIASACGFSDYNYFITIFKRLTGTTPKKFRIKNSLIYEIKN